MTSLVQWLKGRRRFKRKPAAPPKALAAFKAPAVVEKSTPLIQAVLNGRGRWLQANQALTQYTGYTLKQWQAVAQDFLTPLLEALEQSAQAQPNLAAEVSELELPVALADGSVRAFYWSAFIEQMDSPEKSRIYLTGRPVEHLTPLLWAEGSADWLTHASHEMRTPLSSVMGLLDLTLQSGLSDKQQRWLEIARQSTQAALDTLEDVLDVSRMAPEGSPAYRDNQIDVRLMMIQLRQLFYVQCKEKGLQFVLDVDPAVPNYLLGDGLRLRQILVNLLSNAVKFTAHGQVKLSVWQDLSPTEKTASPESVPTGLSLLHFCVADTGTGFLPEQQQRLFEPFARLSNTSTQTVAGTGLGLYIAKRLALVLKGSLWAESQPGQGSWFHLSLPFERQKLKHPELVRERSMLFLTPADCGCGNDHDSVLDSLGVSLSVEVYPTVPPPPVELLERYVDADYYYLCTQHMTNENVFDWLADPVLKAMQKPLLLTIRIPEPAHYLAKHNHPAESPDEFLERLDVFQRQYSAPCLLISHSNDFPAAFERITTWQAQQSSMVREKRTSPVMTKHPSHWSSSSLGLSGLGRPTVSGASKTLSVLLVEDNPVCQFLISQTLEALPLKQLVEIAVLESATEVLPYLKTHAVDLILLDTHLREEASPLSMQTLIETVLSLPQAPSLVLLSADLEAVTRQRFPQVEHCLSKPLEASALTAIIEALQEKKQAVKDALPDFDVAPLLARLQGNQGLMQEVLRLFLEDVPMHQEACRQALACKDWETLHKKAHQLKGSGTYIEALMLKKLAYSLEVYGLKALAAQQAGQSEAEIRLEKQAQTTFAELDAELIQLHQTLESYLELFL